MTADLRRKPLGSFFNSRIFASRVYSLIKSQELLPIFDALNRAEFGLTREFISSRRPYLSADLIQSANLFARLSIFKSLFKQQPKGPKNVGVGLIKVEPCYP